MTAILVFDCRPFMDSLRLVAMLEMRQVNGHVMLRIKAFLIDRCSAVWPPAEHRGGSAAEQKGCFQGTTQPVFPSTLIAGF